ncbi:uncharacterized protein G2W53_009712 [Senna tora]|uniref:Uncharacterized protein n=1 Tax=Senna tora TaxID=362788 RepID=A0A834WZK0_9FABA|nr:uncharacterized protein G2W53_009712 [Senna tora]
MNPNSNEYPFATNPNATTTLRSITPKDQNYEDSIQSELINSIGCSEKHTQNAINRGPRGEEAPRSFGRRKPSKISPPEPERLRPRMEEKEMEVLNVLKLVNLRVQAYRDEVVISDPMPITSNLSGV